MIEEFDQNAEQVEYAEPVEEDVEAEVAPRRNRSRREPRSESVEPMYDGVYSRVREVLETSNAWNALMTDERVSQFVRYTEEGVEAVAETPPATRALLYNAATAILSANGVRYDAQHERPFYAREAND